MNDDSLPCYLDKFKNLYFGYFSNEELFIVIDLLYFNERLFYTFLEVRIFDRFENDREEIYLYYMKSFDRLNIFIELLNIKYQKIIKIEEIYDGIDFIESESYLKATSFECYENFLLLNLKELLLKTDSNYVANKIKEIMKLAE